VLESWSCCSSPSRTPYCPGMLAAAVKASHLPGHDQLMRGPRLPPAMPHLMGGLEASGQSMAARLLCPSFMTFCRHHTTHLSPDSAAGNNLTCAAILGSKRVAPSDQRDGLSLLAAALVGAISAVAPAGNAGDVSGRRVSGTLVRLPSVHLAQLCRAAAAGGGCSKPALHSTGCCSPCPG
jgi:hypothetical protein